MGKLVAAEWLKVRRRPAFIVLFLCMGGAGLFVVPIFTILALRGTFVQEAGMALAFPHSLLTSSRLIGNISLLPLVIFTATLAGSEFTGDTWKMLIFRRASRYPFFLAKLVVIAIVAVVVPIFSVALWTSVGALGASIAGLEQAPLEALPIRQALISLSADAVMWIFIVAASLFGAFVGRSVVGGILAGLLLLPLIQILGLMGEEVARWLPEIHHVHISSHILGDPSRVAEAQKVLGGDFPLAGSIAVYGLYVLTLLVTAMIVFERRDLAG